MQIIIINVKTKFSKSKRTIEMIKRINNKIVNETRIELYLFIWVVPIVICNFGEKHSNKI